MKPTLLLDLDQTIISTEKKSLEWANGSRLHYVLDKTSGEKNNIKKPSIIFARPYLKEFLNFVFSKFRIGVYTAATKDYAMLIIKTFFDKHLPEFIFTRRHLCLHPSSKGPKEIAGLIQSDVNASLPAEKRLTQSTTFLLDDNADCYSHQPSNVIIAKPFYSRDYKTDTFLYDLTQAIKSGHLFYPTNNINRVLKF